MIGWMVARCVAWLVVAIAGSVLITQALSWPGTRTIAIFQSLTPYLALLIAPVAVVALLRRHLWMALVSALIGIGALVLAVPLVFPPGPPAAADRAAGVRIASLNLLYTNQASNLQRVADDLGALDPDVIVFTEYTKEHQQVLQASALAEDYEYRTDRSEPGGGGVAIWSKEAVVVAAQQVAMEDSLDLTVDGPDGRVRVVAVHPPTPITDFDAWRNDLAQIGEVGRRGDTPTVVIGDFNASFWHPSFRALLDDGFTDAHIAAGKGFSTSWPTNRPYPPFVRLDHALTTDALVSTDVEDFDIAGSDHRGLIVTVAPAR